MADKKLSEETTQITNLADDVRLYGINKATTVPASGWIDPADLGEANTASSAGGTSLVLA